jgi:hypothetical protein
MSPRATLGEGIEERKMQRREEGMLAKIAKQEKEKLTPVGAGLLSGLVSPALAGVASGATAPEGAGLRRGLGVTLGGFGGLIGGGMLGGLAGGGPGAAVGMLAGAGLGAGYTQKRFIENRREELEQEVSKRRAKKKRQQAALGKVAGYMTPYEQGYIAGVRALEKTAAKKRPEDSGIGALPVGALSGISPIFGGLASGLSAPEGEGAKRGFGVGGAGVLGAVPGAALTIGAGQNQRLALLGKLLSMAGAGVGGGLAQRHFLNSYDRE